MARYSPPVQGKLSQLFDVIVLLTLAIGALFVPLKMGLSGSTKHPVAVENPTWESLGQNTVQAAQYEALGYTPETAADLITARFDYSFTVGGLIAMVVVIVLYYALMLRFSETEYREVIAEKFDGK